MAKRNNNKPPRPNHKAKRTKSQHDKRKRLDTPNTKRKKTRKARVPLVGKIKTYIAFLATRLDARIAFRLAIIVSGMFLADDRRTASAWFAAAGVQDDWDRFYDALTSIGRVSTGIATEVLKLVLKQLDPGPGGKLKVAIDDSPTKRYGPHIEGAGVHHNPTPGPVGCEWLYGHNFVCLALLAMHPAWGVIALPLLSMLYVRKDDVAKLPEKYGWTFRTKHELAVVLVEWFVSVVKSLGMTAKVWVVADGAYAASPFLRPVLAQGAVVVSRLRKDARLFRLPPAPTGKRGRPRKYGDAISLKKRAAHPRGWQSITFRNRLGQATVEYKTFEATTRLVDGPIRVVLVRYKSGEWTALFCTDSSADVCEILETMSDRWAIEEHFHDVKEVWGSGEQQVRKLWSNVGCWQLNQWLYTLVELSSWDSKAADLVDRTDRPWDNECRRPSHADRRRMVAKEMLESQFLTVLPTTPDLQKMKASLADLIRICL